MRRYDLIKEICDCMIEMGWGPYQNDHEDANGQFEMNWDYDDCLLQQIDILSLNLWLKLLQKNMV